MEKNIDIDFSKSKNYIKNLFSDNHDKDIKPLSYDDFLKIVKQEDIVVSNKNIESFFCPVFLIDKKSNKKYPILFLETKINEIGNGINIKAKDNFYPIYSSILDEFLHEKGISFDKELREADIPAYLFSLQSSIDKDNFKDELVISYEIAFYSSLDILYHSIYTTLPIFSSMETIPKKYLGFFKNIYDEDIEEKVKTYSEERFLAPVHNAIEYLNDYHACKVIYNNISDHDYFLNYFLRNESNKRILFVVKRNEDLNHLLLFLKNNDLFPYAFKYSNFKPLELNRRDFAKFKEKDYSKVIEKNREINQERSDYLKLSLEKQSFYIHPTLENDLQQLVYKSQFEGIDPFELDLSDYTENDFNNDVKFLKSLDQYKSVLSTTIKEHPLYGLSLSNKRENYDNLVLTISQACSKLMEFRNYLKEKGVILFNQKEIDNFREFLELGKDIEILNEYNGFPKRYFKNEEEPEDPRFKLEDLKNLYKAVSSSRLMVENLFDNKIYQQDIDKLVNDYEKGNFFKKKDVKKKLKQFIKNDVTLDYDLFIRILKHYRNAISLLNANLPDYQEIYGDSVLNMNGVIEIESNIKYLNKFKMRGKYNPNFKFDNPRVKRAIKDKEFRYRIISEYNGAKKIYDEFIVLMNKYIGYFIDVRKDYLSMKFDDLNAEFLTKQNITYSIYYEYSSFKKELESTSIQLQLKIREFIIQNKKISLFKNQYLLSLFHAIYLTAETKFKNDDELKEVSHKYFNDINQIPSIRKEMLHKELEYNINLKIDENYDLFNHTIDKISKGIYSIDDIKTSYSLYEMRHPIAIASLEDLATTYEDQFDIVVIYNSKKIDTLSLLGSIDCGKTVLFLNSTEENDIRLQGYNEELISVDRMYLSHFNFNKIPSDFIEYIKGKAPLFGYELIFDNTDFKLVLRNKNDKKEQYALMIDVSISSKMLKHSLSQLREYLQAYKNLRTLNFIMFESLFEKEKFIKDGLDLFKNTSD